MMKKTITKKAAAVLTAALCLSSSMTAFAAPEEMSDGAIFDAEYYALNYPDVVAALGTDTEALFGHYVMFGWSEGRLAFEGDTPYSSNLDNAQTESKPEIIGVQGVIGGTYQLPTWGDYEAFTGNSTDKMITMKVDATPDADYFKYDMEDLAPYTTPGYEWRIMHVNITGTFDYESEANGRWWAYYDWDYDVEGSKNWEWSGEGENYSRKFTVTQDGVDYTECKIARVTGGQTGEVSVLDGIYVLLPKGYAGKAYYTIKGCIPDENGYIIENDDAAVTFVF